MTTQRGWLIGFSVLLAASITSWAQAAQQVPQSQQPSSLIATATNRPACASAPVVPNAAVRPQALAPAAPPKPTVAEAAPLAPKFILAPPAGSPDAGPGRKLLWYVPNRLIDLADIFRFRVRVGPGLAASMRVTDYGSFYYGEYYSLYAGLPGPRNPYYVRSPVGVECLNGVVLGGVDATDDTPYGPAYGPTEVVFGVHLLVVGAEFGIDPLEIADFLSGFLLFDLERDDYPRPRRVELEMTSGVSPGSSRGMFQVAAKPVQFDDLTARLDYLHTNVQQRVSRSVRTTDEFFAPDANQRVEVPDSRLRLGIYAEFIRGKSSDISFKPDVDLDVSLPNLERKLHVFVQSAREDDLPGRTRSETSSQGMALGGRTPLKEYDITADVGIRAKWLPRAYARLTWHPMYEFAQWSFRPQQRIFFDTKEKLGSLSTLYVDRWLGEGHKYYAGSISSAKLTPFMEHGANNVDTNSPDAYIPYEGNLEWEQTFRLGRVRKMIEERAYVGMYERRDVASGGDISASVFGTDSHVDTYRITVGMRRPLYQEWIFWEVEPGLEWTAENNYDTAFRITLGVDMLFWGPTSK